MDEATSPEHRTTIEHFEEDDLVTWCDACYLTIGYYASADDGVELIPYWKQPNDDLAQKLFGLPARRPFVFLCNSCSQNYADEKQYRERKILPRTILEPEDWQPNVGGWALVHCRDVDMVYFGPFATIEEAEEWLRDVGEDRGVRPHLVPLVSPTSNPRNIWQDPVRKGQIQIADK